MLLTGKIGLNQLSGPVGIVDVVDDTYKASKSYGGFAVSVQAPEYRDSSVSQPGGYESSAISGSGRRKACLPVCEPCAWQRYSSGEGRICASGRDRPP